MRVANVSYYFGSKQNLYYEVLRRRSEPLSRMRLERIGAARAQKIGREQKLNALVAAYADPPLELSRSGDAGWKNFFSLIGQVTFTGFAPPQIAEFFNQPARQLMAALSRALLRRAGGKDSGSGAAVDRALSHGDYRNRPHRDLSRAGILVGGPRSARAADEGFYRRRDPWNVGVLSDRKPRGQGKGAWPRGKPLVHTNNSVTFVPGC